MSSPAAPRLARFDIGGFALELTVTVRGLNPLVLHNVRLANPLDPITRDIKTISGKRKKTDEDLSVLFQLEARGSIYETIDGLVGYPSANMWRSFHDAAKAFKRGEDVKRGLLHPGSIEPLLIAGEPAKVDDFLADVNNIDLRPMTVNRSKTMRARPIIHDWAATFTFDVVEDVFDGKDLLPIFERAGRLIGTGDSRQIGGGRFAVDIR